MLKLVIATNQILLSFINQWALIILACGGSLEQQETNVSQEEPKCQQMAISFKSDWMEITCLAMLLRSKDPIQLNVAKSQREAVAHRSPSKVLTHVEIRQRPPDATLHALRWTQAHKKQPRSWISTVGQRTATLWIPECSCVCVSLCFSPRSLKKGEKEPQSPSDPPLGNCSATLNGYPHAMLLCLPSYRGTACLIVSHQNTPRS